METGTLELQIFISLIVILATAFIALVCDYLKGNNESLREYNIELRIRNEEQERHSPVEAIEWLQALLGANERNPVRLATVPSVPFRSQPVRNTAAPAPAAAPAARRYQSDDIAVIAARLGVGHADERDDDDVEESMQTSSTKARKQGNASTSGPTLLQTFTAPEWVRREKDEKAAARRLRDEQVAKPKSSPLPTQEKEEQVVLQPMTAETPYVSAAGMAVEGFAGALIPDHKKENYWTYRGLLDRVVAATSGGAKKAELVAGPPILKPEPLPATEPVIASEEVIAVERPAADLPVEHSEQFEHIATVAIDLPSGPMGTGSHPEMTAPVADEAPHGSTEESIAYEADEGTDAEPEESADTEMHSGPQPVTVAAEPSPPASSAIPRLQLPTGFHDRSVLPSLMASTGVMDGVVVAIGINDYAHHKEKMGAGPMADLMRSVENMVCGLLRKDIDFGCRSNEDEFVLVFPGETGVEAQRRLTTISERLWNFQLRSLTNFSVFFSWGAVEVSGETLPDAAASASERMYQTKRNRKTVTLDSQRRKLAV